MAGPYDHLIGELSPGDKGWLPLDNDGFPNGPAVKEPPPQLGFKAASVVANAKDPLGPEDHALLTSTGAELDPPLNSNVDRRVTPGQPQEPPVLDSLTPTGAVVGDPDLTLTVTGSNFTEGSIIVFNGGDEVTTYVSPTSLTTGVKPSLVGAPITVPVEVRDSGGVSNSLSFAFTAPVGRGAERSRR